MLCQVVGAGGLTSVARRELVLVVMERTPSFSKASEKFMFMLLAWPI